MTTAAAAGVDTLAFDIFGTVLDLAGSLARPLEEVLAARSSPVAAPQFWAEWRARQRVEQYQDTLLMRGHSGYLETCRRALVYTAERLSVGLTEDDVASLVAVWRELRPFEDSVPAIERLRGAYRTVALSNGEPWLLDHVVERLGAPFDDIISVEQAGVFKPHPAVYRAAVTQLGAEPQQLMMVSSHSFDVMGARASGYRAAYVDRYRLPYEVSPYRPDLWVSDFDELAEKLLDTKGERQ